MSVLIFDGQAPFLDHLFFKSGASIVYSYDDKGERILKKTASVNEYYLRDHVGRELAIYDLTANRIKMANIFGNGLIGRVDVNWVQTSGFYWDENHMKVFYTTTTRSDDRCYYLKDHLGSNRMTINSLGVVTNVQDYYAYGEVLRNYNNSTPNEKYKFTGKERDTETDLDYFGARFYDSEIGRWLSVDPLASKYPAWSPYNYCLDNPIRFIDPDGRNVDSAATDRVRKAREELEKNKKKFSEASGILNKLFSGAQVVLSGLGVAYEEATLVTVPGPAIVEVVGTEVAAGGLNASQLKNLGRFEKNLPSNASPTIIRQLPAGSKSFQATVPARNIPGSYAIYEKQVDVNGFTLEFTKTTVSRDATLVHMKDKIRNIIIEGK